MKIVVLDGFMVREQIPDWKLDEMFTVTWYDETPADKVCERIGDAQAVFVNRTRLTAQVFEQCSSLRFAGSFGTGYNQIDISAARQAGVTVCNVPDYSTAAVAQHTISLLLCIASQTCAHDRFIKQGDWKTLSDPPLVSRGAFEVAGKTLGLIGYGNIARQVARIALALDMRVVTTCRTPERVLPGDGVRWMPLDQLLRESDIVSLHCPLTEQTSGMVDEAFLAGMKKCSVLINTARGAILQEAAVAAALDSGQLWMAGLDVFPEEPVPQGHPLAFHPKVIATPHTAWTPNQTRERLLAISAENLLCFLAENPQNVVS